MWGCLAADQVSPVRSLFRDSRHDFAAIADASVARENASMGLQIILDDARAGHLRRYVAPRDVILAHDVSQIAQAFARIETALGEGRHVAGYFSYELGYALEARLQPLMPQDRRVPLLWFGVFDAVEEHDNVTVLEHAVSGRAYAGPLRHEWNEAQYTSRFARVHDAIRAGDIYQANLSFRSRFAFLGDARALYLRLREKSAAAHGAFLDTGEHNILSLSPEMFFDISADGKIVVRPMKGTAARGDDVAADEAAREGLHASVKDRAENLMIVDLMRNDLSRIAARGSVEVEKLFAIETYPTLHQMTSTVTAQLPPQTRVEQIVRALFPCGSVTGTPKIRAMQIIRELEASPRGVYCGTIGHFAPDGSAQFNVAIRTLTIAGNKGELGIGGAIVYDSTAQSEYAECLLKARYYDSARKKLELIETLRWSPAEGFLHRSLHLARMARSAATLGIQFNAAAAMRAPENAVSQANETMRVRLTLSEAGAFACTAATMSSAKPVVWTYAISPHRMASSDALLQHKTSWREVYENEHARFASLGCDEVLFLNERGELTEGSRTNVFVQIGGKLFTPPLSAGVLDGCLRREMIDKSECAEATLTPQDMDRAEKIWLGNSLRGLIAAVPFAAKDVAE
jgi:para-aminobenzoate synthetase/4-amino-4-deoxychorismate lyase